MTKGDRFLHDIVLTESEDNVDLLFGDGWEAAELAENDDALGGGDVALLDAFGKEVDGVAGSSNSSGIDEEFEFALIGSSISEELLDFGNSAHAEKFDDLLELESSIFFESVGLVFGGFGDFADHGLDHFNLVLDLSEGTIVAGEFLIAVLVEAFLKAVEFSRVEKGFFLGVKMANSGVFGLLLDGVNDESTSDDGLHGIGPDSFVHVLGEEFNIGDGVLVFGSDDLVPDAGGTVELLFLEFLDLGGVGGLLDSETVVDGGELGTVVEGDGFGDVVNFTVFIIGNLVDGV